MNIFNKVTLNSLRKSRTRTLVTIIGVILSSAMITAVSMFGISLLRYMEDGAAKKYGGWHVAFLDADSSFMEEQKKNSKVASAAAYENIGYSQCLGENDEGKPYLFIAGFDEKTLDAIPITLLSGRMPENSSEILISGNAVKNDGDRYAAGSKISLQVGNRMSGTAILGQKDPYNQEDETFVTQKVRDYTVVGTCQTPAFEDEQSPGHTVITLADSSDKKEEMSVFVTLKNPRGVNAYVKSVSENHSYILNNRVLRFMGLSDDSGDQIFTTLLYAAGAIVIAIIMIGSVFLIYNSFHISLNERMQQFGILASVGATEKQLRNSVLFEGVCIGAVGIPIGVITGIGSIGLVIAVVSKNFGSILYSNVPLTLHVSVPVIAVAAVISMITILISASIPARKAAHTPVMECIRQTNEIKIESKTMKTSGWAQRIYGLEGTLAQKNFKRNKRRYRSIVLSLVLSIILFVSTSAFVTDLKQAADQLKSVTDYDIGFGTQNMEDTDLLMLYDKLRTAGGICESSYQFVFEYFCEVPRAVLSDAYLKLTQKDPAGEMAELAVDVRFLDDTKYLNLINSLNLPEAEYKGPNGKMIAVAKMEGENMQEGVEQLPDLFVNSSVDTTLVPNINGSPDAAQAINLNITCVEIIPPDIPPVAAKYEETPYFFQIIAPYSMKNVIVSTDLPADIKVKGLTFQADDPSKTAAEMQEMIKGLEITSAYLFFNASEIFDESRNYVFIANVFAYTFIIMISLIAAANVFNTISTNIKLRRRELAMLRSVGMSDRDFNKMMCFECAFYGMRALLFGIPAALVSSWLIYRGMFAAGAEGISFTFPWASIGISVFSVLLVILAAMMYSVRKIKKENIIDALRDDLT